ncbi:MAG TPA: hypothetical protein VFV37_09430 [Luteibaculaceae bacterium]|nr:hypothetical protein [Luteibaculaceae bacterium]
MKKTILAVAALAVSLTGFSQDLMSKKGEAILPEAGDYALGFDAVPLFNALKFNSAATIGAGYPNQYMGVMVKRFTDAKNATRFGIRFGVGSDLTIEEVEKRTAGAVDGDNLVENRLTSKGFDATFSYGKEMRRGNTRVQGYWGYEGMLNLNARRTTIEYGNDFNDLPNTNPYVGGNPLYGNDDAVYLTQSRSGIGFGLGARAFIGVEYFIAPKISINAEYGFGAMLNTTPRGERDVTTVDGGVDTDETIEGTVRTSSFNLATDITQGAVRMIFHF